MEQWHSLDFLGYPKYSVSNLGACKGPTKKLKPQKAGDGYLMVRLYNRRGSKLFLLHRLVAECFLPNPENLPQVNHGDGNKRNCAIDNLEWCTRDYNMQHASEHGLLRRGESHELTKVSEAEVRFIKEHYGKGPEFNMPQLAKRFGISVHNVRNIVRGITWKHVVAVPKKIAKEG